MAKIGTILVDDDELSRTSLKILCGKSEHIDLIAVFDHPVKALEFLSQHEIDLLISDIEMSELSGLELIHRIAMLPQIILVSSHKEYAFDAFEYDVTDYLQKPVTFDRFSKAIQRVLSKKESWANIVEYSYQKEVYIRTDGKLIRIPIDQILYFENISDYVKIITDTKVYVIGIALRVLYERLNHPRLLKVHRSYIVNMDKITDIQENSILIQNKIIPVSRAHKPILMNSINIIN